MGTSITNNPPDGSFRAIQVIRKDAAVAQNVTVTHAGLHTQIGMVLMPAISLDRLKVPAPSQRPG